MTPMTIGLRLTVATCWALSAVGFAVSLLLEPEGTDNTAALLRSLSSGGSGPALSFFAFSLAQLPFMVAVAGLAYWLHAATPRLALTGGVLAVLGGFGEAVYSGVEMSQTVMADDPTHIRIYARLIDDIQTAPVMVPFLAAGLLGTVLGVLVLGLAHLRSAAQPRWAGPLLWAWIVLVFVGESAGTRWAVYLSGLCMVVAFAALARSIARDSARPHRPA